MKIRLDPQPGFVVKSVVVNNGKQKQGTKVFLNICTDPQVPGPNIADGADWNDLIQRTGDIVVPIVLSEMKEETDNKGRYCIVWDCCIHPKVLYKTVDNPAVKELLIGTCFQLIEERDDIAIGEEYNLPKRRTKGKLSRTVVWRDGGDEVQNENVKEQDYAESGNLTVSQSMESFAKEIAKGKHLTDKERSEKQILKKPLIQEIASEETSVEPTYRIISLDERTQRIDITGFDEQQLHNIMIKGTKITINQLVIRVDKEPKHVQAVFAKDTQKVSILYNLDN